MSLLAIDIETASPNSNPSGSDFQNTDHFELVAVGLGYQDHPDAPVETEVLFRDGGWDLRHTAQLLLDVIDWAKERKPNYAISYNGNGFDKIHLLNWAKEADDEYKTTNIHENMQELFTDHIDLMRPAAAVYGHPGQRRLKLETALDDAGISFMDTYYRDYDLPDSLTTSVDTGYVQNKHIGDVLGEAYVNYIAAPSQPHTEYSGLKELLYDYTAEDIEPLFGLAESLRQTL